MSLTVYSSRAEVRAWGGSASGSVRAMTMAKRAPWAPEENHLWPLSTQSSPSLTAVVWMRVGSDPATSGSVIAKQERHSPLASGRGVRVPQADVLRPLAQLDDLVDIATPVGFLALEAVGYGPDFLLHEGTH